MYRYLWIDLTDEQWKVVEAILPEDPVRDDDILAHGLDERRCLVGPTVFLWAINLVASAEVR
jgi:transposase